MISGKSYIRPRTDDRERGSAREGNRKLLTYREVVCKQIPLRVSRSVSEVSKGQTLEIEPMLKYLIDSSNRVEEVHQVKENNALKHLNLTVVEQLVNIPVELPEGSGILKEIDIAEHKNKGKEIQVSGQSGRKRWRKLKGKENALSVISEGQLQY